MDAILRYQGQVSHLLCSRPKVLPSLPLGDKVPLGSGLAGSRNLLALFPLGY